jgi:hypothetical protein
MYTTNYQGALTRVTVKQCKTKLPYTAEMSEEFYVFSVLTAGCIGNAGLYGDCR